ncbi:MAG: hypothetical protein ACXWYO_07955 [Gaiellaceae bacterium]
MTIAPAPLEQRRAAHRRQIVVVLAALAALLGTGVVLHDDLVGGSSGSGTVQGSASPSPSHARWLRSTASSSPVTRASRSMSAKTGR